MKMKLFVPCPCSHAHTPQKKVFYQKTESPSNPPFQATPPREHETSLIIQTKEKTKLPKYAPAISLSRLCKRTPNKKHFSQLTENASWIPVENEEGLCRGAVDE